MKSQSYQHFIESLQSQVPDRRVLVNELMALLAIEKEAVYRRLRREVAFPFYEIELIAKKYHISLDYIIENRTINDMVFYLVDYDFINTPQEYLNHTQDYLDKLSGLKDDPLSEAGFAVNSFPITLIKSKEHKHIYHLLVYKWLYQYGKYTRMPAFSELVLPEKLLEFNQLHQEKLMYANYTYYVFDDVVFNNLIKDIQYFILLKAINPEEVKILKGEMLDLLDSLEELSITGEFSTGKKIHLYVTQMSIDTSYSYIDSVNCSFAFFKVFSLNEITSSNSKNLPRIKDWLQALKKSSLQITGSGELQRVKYFNKQRELINQL